MRPLLTLACFIALASQALGGRPFLCYWESWAQYRKGNHKGTVDKIPTNLCTHVIYSFMGLDAGSNTVIPLDRETYEKDLHALVGLKHKAPGIKITAAIGGWGDNPKKYSNMVSNADSRKKFVASVLNFVNKFHLDGVDIDWEYPGVPDRQGKPSDKQNFVSLLKELRQALGNNRVLTIAVGAPVSIIRQAYDVANIVKYVTYINVMSYDLHGTWDGVTASHVGLHAAHGQSADSTVAKAMQNFVAAGAPKNKLIMGFGFYGRSFTLKNPNDHKINAPISGPGQAGEVSQEAGSLFYYEICQRIKHGWARVFDHTIQGPYAFHGNQWVGYEDVEGINYKVDLIKKEGYAGAMVWAISLDDAANECGGGSYPLANRLVSKLRS